jgi:hypothetical protein
VAVTPPPYPTANRTSSGANMSKANLMTEKEIHAFGVDIVLEEMQKDGFSIESVNKDIRINPQIIAKKNNETIFVVVRTACYPYKGRIEDTEVVSQVTRNAKRYDAGCYFASVGIANSLGSTDMEMSIPTRGAGYYVAYEGLEKLSKVTKSSKFGRVSAFNKDGMIAGGVKRTKEGKHILISDKKADISSLTMSLFYVFAGDLTERQRKVFSSWANLPLDMWSERHREKFSIAGMHYLLDLKSNSIEIPSVFSGLIKSLPAQPLPPLPKPLNQEIHAVFKELFGISDNESSRIEYIKSKWSEVLLAARRKDPRAQAILNVTKSIDFSNNTLLITFNSKFVLAKANEMKNLMGSLFEEVLGFPISIKFLLNKNDGYR